MTSGERDDFSFRRVGADGEPEGPEITLDTARPWVRIRCPCGGDMTAGVDTAGKACGLHSLPACVAFELEELDEYLRNARLNGARLLESGPKP